MNHSKLIASLLTCLSFLTFSNEAVSTSTNKCIRPDGRIEFTDQSCPSDSISSFDKNKKPPQSIEHKSQQTRSEAKGLETSNGLSAEDRLKSCDPNIAIAAAQEIVGNPINLKEPLQLFYPAFAFFQNGRKDEGAFWFYAAQLRTRQQLIVENGDRGQLLAIMLITIGGPINSHAFQNTSNLNQILDRVLEWDKKTANPFIDKARSQKLDKKIDQVYAGFNELKSKLVSEKTSLEAAARKAAIGDQQLLDQTNSQRCRKGQPDPAYENQTRKEEERLAFDYVKNNKQIIKLVGGSVETSPASPTSYSNDRNKGRYDFSIMGAKTIYAIVDVNRSSGKPEFSLACVTTLSMGAREAFKDVCTQSTITLPK
jgi:hypothetical protein